MHIFFPFCVCVIFAKKGASHFIIIYEYHISCFHTTNIKVICQLNSFLRNFLIAVSYMVSKILCTFIIVVPIISGIIFSIYLKYGDKSFFISAFKYTRAYNFVN